MEPSSIGDTRLRGARQNAVNFAYILYLRGRAEKMAADDIDIHDPSMAMRIIVSKPI